MTTRSFRRGDHSGLTMREIADRLAIRELVDAYAYRADRRDAAGQMGLFTEDTDFLVYMDSSDPAPTQHLRGRDALAPVFDNLNTYQATITSTVRAPRCSTVTAPQAWRTAWPTT